MRPESYITKQYEAILSYIASLGGSHVTAAQIVEHFDNEGSSIGRTTVYRHLDKLTESGKIRRYAVDGISGACFQYINHNEDCRVHLHLKCENCGKLLHLHCDMLDEIQRHMSAQHAFQINPVKTVLYGKCESCLHDIYTHTQNQAVSEVAVR